MWGLCEREYEALKDQWQLHRDFQLGIAAAIRADIHNCAGKKFEHHFESKDFLPGGKVSIEERAKEFIAMGYPPHTAVAMASMRRERGDNLRVLDGTLRSAHAAKVKGKGRRARAG